MFDLHNYILKIVGQDGMYEWDVVKKQYGPISWRLDKSCCMGC